MIVGTAGHVDHGKTALVRALTGVDTDRLPQEKARGISIELGYAYWPLPGAAEPGAVLGFVDVPGHERFLHHMLAGVTGIDFVLLVVALDDGPMPQTREHLQILDLLGCSRGLVVLTKRDRVDAAREAAVRAQLRSLLAGTTLAAAPVLAVSAHTGEGLAALREQLIAAAASEPPRAVRGRFRLAVDRCFTLAGTGLVVAGTVHAGRVAVGDRLVLTPGGTPLRVRSIHAHNRPAEQGLAGQRVALNVTGPRLDAQAVQRGQWVADAALDHPTTQLDVHLHLLASEARALKRLTPVHLHLGADHLLARVDLLDVERLEPGRAALARLTLPRPIGALAGDRFVLRDASASRTLGGGSVLDPFAPARRRRAPERLAWLQAWQQGGAEAAWQHGLHRADGLDATAWAQAANRDEAELAAALARPGVQVVPTHTGPRAFAQAVWQAAQADVRAALAGLHAAQPQQAGLPRDGLRRAVRPTWPEEAFDALLRQLATTGALVRTGTAWHLRGHTVQLDPAEHALWQRIQPLLQAKPLAPPRVDQLARQLDTDEPTVRTTLDRVAQTGTVYAVSEARFYLREPIEQLAATLRTLAQPPSADPATDPAAAAAAEQPLTAAGLRDAIGIGRNLCVALLEFYDRIGYTRRAADHHWLRADHRHLFDNA